jgi:hypothetical protein
LRAAVACGISRIVTPKNLPWVLWELNRGARKPSLYGTRVVTAFFALFLVAQVAMVSHPGLRSQWRGASGYLMVANLAVVGGGVLFMRRIARSSRQSSLTTERNEGTLALLLCTPRRPFEVVLLKTLPAWAITLGATLGCVPILLISAFLQLWPLDRAVGVVTWFCSLMLFSESARVALTCTKLGEKAVQAALSIGLGAFIGAPLILHALFSNQSWAQWLTYLNPMQAIVRGPTDRLLVASALHHLWSLACLWIGAAWLTKEVYPVRGRLRLLWQDFTRRMRRLIPWRTRIGKWLLERYPIAWLNLRSFVWIAFPLAILAGIACAGMALLHAHDAETAGVILGCAGFLAFAFVIGTRTSVDHSLRAERESRMNEVIHPLPIPARNVAVSRLVECAFWVGPSLALLWLAATIVTAWFIDWKFAVPIFIGLLEVCALCAMICLGTHVGACIPKKFLEPDQWILAIIAVGTVVAIPGSMGFVALVDGGVGVWLICSVARLAMELFLTQFLFGMLVRKIESGEQGSLTPLA